MNNAQEFTVRGDTLTNRSISLSSGYHIVPVLSNVPCLIESVFENPQTDIMLMYDVKTSALYWPAGGISTLTLLEPGKGYIATFNNPVTLTYPAYSGLKSGMMDEFTDPLLGSPWPIVRTADVHFVSIRNEAVNNLENIDFIGAFDSFGNCIGYTRIDGSTQNYLLTLFGEDETTSIKDGAAQSEPILFRSYSSSTNKKTELIPVFNTGFPNSDGMFASNGQSEITSFKASATGIGETGIAGSVQIYPNPAKDVLYINLNSPPAGGLVGLRATLISTEGKTVKTFKITGNQTQLDVSNLQPGVYILRIENAESVVVKRLVIQ
jgi:hypothetical protein